METGSVTAAASLARASRLGVALSDDRIVVMQAGGAGSKSSHLWSRTLTPMPTPGNTWPDLQAAFADLRSEIGARGRLSIALMPSLAALRTVELPPLKGDESRKLLARNAGRYFVGVTEPQTVGILRLQQGAGAHAGGTLIATATATRTLDAIHRAARDAGWKILSVAPAFTAWVSAARTLWPSSKQRPTRVLVLGIDHTDLIRLDRGRLLGIRQFRAGDADLDLAVEALVARDESGYQPQVAVVGDEAATRRVTARLSSAGVVAMPAPSGTLAIVRSADALAAASVHGAKELELLPDGVLAARRAQAQRVSVWMATAAAVMLMAMAGFELWGAQRELAIINDQRFALKAGVADVIKSRALIEADTRRIAALQPIATQGPRWSAVLTTLATRLPHDAYLTSVRAQRDTLRIEGLADNAARVFAAVQAMPDVGSAKPMPFRTDVDEAGKPIQSFVIQVKIGSTPPSTTGPGAATKATARGASPAGRQ
jgi:Tfp pilus assembly protein PilN